jgi:hypothetical protein
VKRKTLTEESLEGGGEESVEGGGEESVEGKGAYV